MAILEPKPYDIQVKRRSNFSQLEWEYYIENMGKRFEDSQVQGLSKTELEISIEVVREINEARRKKRPPN